MKIVKAGYKILTTEESLCTSIIEIAGRTCYKSDASESKEEHEEFIKGLIAAHHFSVLEHVNISVKIQCDRGISHELVRHRIASYSQESTRYCNYSKDKFDKHVTFVNPCYLDVLSGIFYRIPEDYYYIKDNEGNPTIYRSNGFEKARFYYLSCLHSERDYFALLAAGCTAQEARGTLNTWLKTEVIATMNVRQWRHFFALRVLESTGKVHPSMLEISIPLYAEMSIKFPILFDNINKGE